MVGAGAVSSGEKCLIWVILCHFYDIKIKRKMHVGTHLREAGNSEGCISLLKAALEGTASGRVGADKLSVWPGEEAWLPSPHGGVLPMTTQVPDPSGRQHWAGRGLMRRPSPHMLQESSCVHATSSQ